MYAAAEWLVLSVFSLSAFCPKSSALRTKGSSADDEGKASIVQGTLSSLICSFICRDQLLVLAVFLSCPLERGGSQLERGARGYALSPLCGETHRGIERLSAGAERRSEREHTWGGWFFYFFSSQKSDLFFEALFSAGTFLVWRTYLLEVHYTRGRERVCSTNASSLTARDTCLQIEAARINKA